MNGVLKDVLKIRYQLLNLKKTKKRGDDQRKRQERVANFVFAVDQERKLVAPVKACYIFYDVCMIQAVSKLASLVCVRSLM